MSARDVKALYGRLGPVLYARALRVLADERAAEEMTKEVVIDLSALEGKDDAELLKVGRDLLQQRCADRGKTSIDSLVPGLDSPKKPKQ
ncbi:MAG: hypothetical protein AMXMBFR34_45750 [Myxococcaceae bacterium]